MFVTRSSALGRSTMILGISSVVTQIFGFIYRIFLARIVSAEVLGIFQLIMPVYSVALSISATGLTIAVSQQTATLQAAGHQRSIRRLMACCVGVFLALIGGLTVFMAFFYDPVSVYVLGDARTAAGLLLLIPCLALTGVENLHKHYFYGTGNVKPAAFVEMLEMLVRAFAVLTLLHIFLPQSDEKSVALIVCGMIICELFSSVTLFTLVQRDIKHRGFFGRKEGVSLKEIGVIAVPVGISAVMGTLMNAFNSVLIPQRLVFGGADVSSAMSAFGILSGMTMPLLNLPTSLIGALNLVLLPRLSESLAKRDSKGLQRRLNKSLRLTICTMLPAMVLIYLLGDDLGVLLFAQKQVGAFLAPMAAGTFFACLCSMTGAALNGLGQQKRAARISILCGAVQVIFTYFFVGLPQVGLRGYAIGFLVSSLLGAMLSYRPVARQCRLRFDFFSWVVAPGLSSLLMGLCINLLHPVLLVNGIPAGIAVLTSIVFGVVLYISCLSALGVRLFT